VSISETSPRERARPLPPDDRREAILWAALPLIKEHGRNVSTRQIAEAAGIAEGTLFRAFGDKDSLIQAAVERFFDPVPLIAALRSIDPDLPLEQKLSDVLVHLRARFTGMVTMMTALGMSARPPVSVELTEQWMNALRDLLAPHEAELTVPPETVAYYLRLLAFASSFSQFNVAFEFATDQLASLVAHGVTRSECAA
jgi:AcrR family transcriptional regulator